MGSRMEKQSAKTFDGNTSGKSPVPKPPSDAEFWPLSGRPYFHIVIGKKKYFQVPQKVSAKLPTAKIPVKMVYRGKAWDLLYLGDQPMKRFESEGWGKFKTDNNLVADDACVFELMEGSSVGCVKFKVQILRNDFPTELLEKAEGTMNNPMTLE